MTTARHIIILTVLVIFLSCNQRNKKTDLQPLTKIETVDYRDLYKQFQKTGFDIFPIVYDKSLGSKRLVFIGVRHSNDTLNPMYDTIQKYFILLTPQIAVNEGGQVKDSLHFSSRNKAIMADGEIGFLKYLSDNEKIKMINGDCADSIEIPALLKEYDKDKLLYFLVIQRFIPQFIQAYGTHDLKSEYTKFINKYLIRDGKFPLTVNECEWTYFEMLYQKYNENKKIDLENFDLSQTEPFFYDEGIMGQIGRSSMQIRDSIIVTNIYNNLLQYDKVFVVFGGAHLFAIMPTLDKMFEK